VTRAAGAEIENRERATNIAAVRSYINGEEAEKALVVSLKGRFFSGV